ncbi:MAG: ribosome silencing factor [Omnitrophica bacterium RIFCSPLOWO2_12_FULL_50_11]|nr:MAG: ribosome silencing factor [Omnitrophica bacterium RIFCSPLOWO2_12_FULL_50_11]
MNARTIAQVALFAAEEKKAIDPLVLDIRRMSDIADFFVIASGSSDRHVRTIAEAVMDSLRTRQLSPGHLEGLNQASWILVDYGTVMVHVFHRETRKFYSLERLWGDAKFMTLKRKDEKPLKSTRRSSTSRRPY